MHDRGTTTERERTRATLTPRGGLVRPARSFLATLVSIVFTIFGCLALSTDRDLVQVHARARDSCVLVRFAGGLTHSSRAGDSRSVGVASSSCERQSSRAVRSGRRRRAARARRRARRRSPPRMDARVRAFVVIPTRGKASRRSLLGGALRAGWAKGGGLGSVSVLSRPEVVSLGPREFRLVSSTTKHTTGPRRAPATTTDGDFLPRATAAAASRARGRLLVEHQGLQHDERRALQGSLTARRPLCVVE